MGSQGSSDFAVIALRSTYSLSTEQEISWQSRVVSARDAVIWGGAPGRITELGIGDRNPAPIEALAAKIYNPGLVKSSFAHAEAFHELAPRLARVVWSRMAPLPDGLRLSLELKLSSELEDMSFSVLTISARLIRPGAASVRAVYGLAVYASDAVYPSDMGGLALREGKGVDLDGDRPEQRVLLEAWKQAVLNLEAELLPLLESLPV
jgi:hypothetical protein